MANSLSDLFSFSSDDLIPVVNNSGAKYRILVIEDDYDIAQEILTTLARAGMECRHTPDYEVALEALSTQDFHLVLLDLNLPGQDGQEISRQAREISTVPLIVLMENQEDNAQMKSFGLGADDHLIKPIAPSLLLLRVMSLLRRAYVYNRKKHKHKVPYSSLPLASPTRPASVPLTPAESTANPPTVVSAAPQITSAPPVDEQKSKTLPSGWSRCDHCDYMGPTPRFQTQDGNGRPIMACPNCGDQSSIEYNLG